MKKIILAIILLAFFLNGCYEHDEAVYECQISIDNSNSDCAVLRGRMRACQILDASYEPDQGMSSYCSKNCLRKSKFLDSVPSECIKVSVAHSRFSESSGIILTIQLGTSEEEVEEAPCLTTDDDSCPDNCNAKNDFNCCVADGKCWIKGTCKSCNEGECEMLSDCTPICENNLLWKQACDVNIAECEKTFSEDCTNQLDTIAGRDLGRICFEGSCVMDKTALESYKKELSEEYKSYTRTRQELTTLRNRFQDEIIYGASKLTTSALTSTYEALSLLTGQLAVLLTESTVRLLGEGIANAYGGDPASMNTAEYFVWNLKARDKIDEEIPIIDQKMEEVFEKAEAVDVMIKSLE